MIFLDFYKQFYYKKDNQHQMAKVLVILAVTLDYQQFAIPELKSILRKTNIPLNILFKYEIDKFPQNEYEINYKFFKNFPLVLLNIPDFETHKQYLMKAACNSVMITKIIHVISEGSNYDEMLDNYNKDLLIKQLSNWDTKVYCQFFSRNRSIGGADQKAKIGQVLSKMNICGKVDSENHQKLLILAQNHTWFTKHHELQPTQTLKNVYFGIQLSSNRILKGKAKFNQKYQLTNRIYLGPTTADNDLAFLMCNQAMIDETSFVLDPFAGTGGLLIPPSHFGAFVFGSDLDIRVLKGYSVGQINKRSKYYVKQKQFQIFIPKIMLNFQQYELKQPQILRMDCLKSRFRVKQMFDAIICDPPYGIRAMSRKTDNKKRDIGIQQPSQKQQIKQIIQEQVTKQTYQNKQIQNKQKIEVQDNLLQEQKQQGQNTNSQLDENQKQKKKQKRKLRKEKRKQRIQALPESEKQFKQQIQNKLSQEIHKKYAVKPKIECTSKDQIYNGLLNFAQQYLKFEGYLVFLYPVLAEQNFNGTGDELPKHPSFKLIDFSTHRMKEGNVRILVTMKKIQKLKQQINEI